MVANKIVIPAYKLGDHLYEVDQSQNIPLDATRDTAPYTKYVGRIVSVSDESVNTHMHDSNLPMSYYKHNFEKLISFNSEDSHSWPRYKINTHSLNKLGVSVTKQIMRKLFSDLTDFRPSFEIEIGGRLEFSSKWSFNRVESITDDKEDLTIVIIDSDQEEYNKRRDVYNLRITEPQLSSFIDIYTNVLGVKTLVSTYSGDPAELYKITNTPKEAYIEFVLHDKHNVEYNIRVTLIKTFSKENPYKRDFTESEQSGIQISTDINKI